MSGNPGVGPVGTDPATRFEAELRRYVMRRVPRPDAEDVLQDVLLRVHLGVRTLRVQERLAPWVFRVARSAVIDHHRRRPPGSLVDETGEVAPDEPLDDVRALLTACVEPFLERLPAEQAEALRLTDLGGLTQVAAAARMGVPIPTFKARVQRGRRRMREAFEACCELERDVRGGVLAATPRACGCAVGASQPVNR